MLDDIPGETRQAMLSILSAADTHAEPSAILRLDAATRLSLAAAGVTMDAVETHSLVGLAHLVESPHQPWRPERPPQVGFVDANLLGFARGMGIPVRGLETPDPSHIAALLPDDPNGAEAASLLRQVLRRRNVGPDLQAWLRTNFAAGQIALVLAGLAAWQTEPEDFVRADRVRARLVSTRNTAWMPTLDRTLHDANAAPAFVAVGAAHLPGTDGLVTRLRARGWTVEACPGDRCNA